MQKKNSVVCFFLSGSILLKAQRLLKSLIGSKLDFKVVSFCGVAVGLFSNSNSLKPEMLCQDFTKKEREVQSTFSPHEKLKAKHTSSGVGVNNETPLF